MEKRQRTRLASALILALVFGTGFVVGLAFDRTAGAAPPAASGETAQTADEQEERGRDERDRRTPLYEQVGELSPEQRARIDAVVARHREASREMRKAWEAEFEPVRQAQEAWEAEHVDPVREKWEPRFDSLIEATRSDIRDVMTPEQAARYDSLLSDYEQRREERRRDHGSDDDRRD